MSYEIRKPVNPFKRPFPTAWVVVGVILLVIAFTAMRCTQPSAPAAMPAAVEMQIPEPQVPEIISMPEEELPERLTVRDLAIPEFPEVDRELASVI